MKIKNIRQFRTFFKERIRNLDSNRNEHFIGSQLSSNNIEKYGWFDIYHGRTPSIRNYLKGFLEMAGDGQAIYEFLQNAVDAKSSHFYMKWDKDPSSDDDYLLICNNGQAFDLNSVISILNVGESTKYENENSIGEYGIGFKLAHKLVGNKNGLDELINEYRGPILFSWKNKEQLKKFISDTDVQPCNFNINQIGEAWQTDDPNPWLFKILLTCFPTLPQNNTVEESVIDLKDEIVTQLFSKVELIRFRKWVERIYPLLESKNYNQGSIIFIKLGDGKKSVFSTKDLKSGIHFSLGILDELKKGSNFLEEIKFNNEVGIQKPSLSYEKYIISKDKVNGFSKEELKSDIEFIIGYRPYNDIKNYFQNKPNFFLFFPLSVEIHYLNFIVHCNHFGKSSSRTHLEHNPNQSGINEKLFKALVYKIRDSFQNYANLKDTKFLDIYAALLSSRKNPNQDRKWVISCFIEPFNNVLQEYIPIRQNETFGITTKRENVFIKQTGIDFKPIEWGFENTEWFYYDLPEFIAPAKDKLKLKTFGLFDVLKKKDIFQKINQWINNEKENALSIIKEIAQAIKSNVPKTEDIKTNIINLKLICFENGETMSLQELELQGNKNYLVLYDGLLTQKNILTKLDVVCSTEDFAEYPEILGLNYLSNNFQLRNKSSAIEIINNCNKENVQSLSTEEKVSLFTSLYNRIPEGKKTEEISKLELFRNTEGDFQKLGSLLNTKKEPWLSKFQIHPEDKHPQINNFLLSIDDKIYDFLIHPYYSKVFTEIVNHKAGKTGLSRIKEYYELSSDKSSLNNENVSFSYKSEIHDIDPSSRIFIDKGLKKIDSEIYKQLQTYLFQSQNITVPDQFQIEFFGEKPWSLEPVNPVLNLDKHYSLEELNLLSKLDMNCRLELFKHKGFKQQNNNLFELFEANDVITFYSEDELLVNFITTHLSDRYVSLIPSLSGITFTNVLTGEYLVKSIVRTLNIEDNDRLNCKFLVSTQHQSPDIKNIVVKSLGKLIIDLKNASESNAVILKLYEDLNSESKSEYENKLAFKFSENEISLSDIDSLDDRVVLEIGSISVSLSRSMILGMDDQLGFSDIERVVQYAISKDLIRESSIDKLFNRTAKNLNQELIDGFLSNNTDEVVENSDQLLLLIYTDLIEDHVKTEFQVYNSLDDLIGIENNLILSSDEMENLVDPEYILHKKYQSIGSHLANINQPYFEFDINEEEYFISPSLPLSLEIERDLLNDSLDQRLLWSFLFKETESQKVEVKWNWNSFEDITDPTQFLLKSQHENELLPTDFPHLNNTQFLKRIGVNRHCVVLSKLRDILGNKPMISDVEGISSLPNKFLLNLIKQFGEEKNKYLRDDIIHKYLIKIFTSLIDSNILPTSIGFLPCLTSIDEIQLVRIDEDLFKILPADLNLIESNHQIQNEFFTKANVVSTELTERFSHLGNVVKLISFDTTWSENQRHDELDERFYKEWKNNNPEYILFKLYDEPQYSISIATNGNVLMESKIHFGHFHLDDEDDENILIYFNPSTITFEKLSEELDNLGHYGLYEMIETRTEYLEEFARSMANNFDNYSDDQKVFIEEESFKNRKDRIRKEKVQALQENEIQFSFDWFADYLELLHSYVDIASLEKQVTIRFQNIKPHTNSSGKISLKYCMLQGSDKVLFPSIENAENLTLVLKYGKKELNEYTVEGVHKVGQNLRAYYPKGFSDKVISSFKEVLDVEIKFTPSIDLIGRLKKAYHEYLAESTWDNIEEHLPPINYIYGPPGTGKTTTLCNIILDKVKEKPDSKILILTPTNKASDVIIKRLFKDNHLDTVRRIGNPTDTELFELDESIYTTSLSNETIQNNNVIALTIHRLPYISIDIEDEFHKLFELEDFWDLIIFDETSMIGIEYMVFALCVFSNTESLPKILIAGDPKQIPPVIELNDLDLEKLDINELNLYKIMGLDNIDTVSNRIRDIDHVEILTTQYRSVPAIGNLFSQYSYRGVLAHNRVKITNTALSKSLTYLKDPISFIDIPLEKDNSVLSVAKLNYSSYHLYSCFLVTEILREIDQQDGKHKIGIITPYKAQAVIINKLIASSDLSDNIDYLCDTVHGFQGDERDTIVFIVNPNNYRYTGHPKALIAKDYIYNVAISRARDRLLILSPIKDYSNPKIENLQRIDKIFSGRKEIIESSLIEQSLFGKKNFIVNNSYVTGHDSVNVYGIVDIGYFIKKNSNSVDVQIQKGKSVYDSEIGNKDNL